MGKSGRPKLKDDEKRDFREVRVWFNENEYNELIKLCEKASEKHPAVYLRKCGLLGNKIIQKPSKIDHGAITDIRKIGVNFNQITMQCNADPNYISSPEWMKRMDDFKELLKDLYLKIIKS